MPGLGQMSGTGQMPGMGQMFRAGQRPGAVPSVHGGLTPGERNGPWEGDENASLQPLPSPDLLTRRAGSPPEPVSQREAPSLQFLQSASRKSPDWQETEGRVRKLEEQIQMQETVVHQLSEGRQNRASLPIPDTGAIAQAVMKRLERELRLEKMRKGLL